jgi:DNA-binding response OmpR family regulator
MPMGGSGQPPRRVLVAEDYGAISLMLDQELRDAGFEVAGPFGSCAAALVWLNAETPDAGILDIELSDGACVKVARTLKERQVPFMVLTGYPSNASNEEAFSGVPWLGRVLIK